MLQLLMPADEVLFRTFTNLPVHTQEGEAQPQVDKQLWSIWERELSVKDGVFP